MTPTIEAWEASLATRDAVFLHIAIITVVVFLAVALLHHGGKKMARIVVMFGFFILLAFLAFSVWNIYAWTP